jgi:hypothetical protein
MVQTPISMMDLNSAMKMERYLSKLGFQNKRKEQRETPSIGKHSEDVILCVLETLRRTLE